MSVKDIKAPLRRLIFRNISVGQLVAYALANFAGLAIILTAMQFYRDINAPDDNTGDYITINKEVNFISEGTDGFTPDEIDDLRQQPWVEDVAGYEASRFQVSAAVDMGGHSMSTHLFFEAIPQEYWDIDSRSFEWHGDESKSPLPVVIPKEYLALYNFGFATARGLPQLSEGVIGTIPVRIRISGNGHDDTFKAYIAGFSSRVNTVAVPMDFLHWANDRYAPGADTRPARLIVHVSRPGDPAIGKYLADHGMQSADNRAVTGRLASFFAIATALVMGVGIVISLLALAILLLSVYLLIQKSRPMLRSLMLLGYSPDSVGSYYWRVVGLINLLSCLLSLGVMMLVRSRWIDSLHQLDASGASLTGAVLVAVLFAIFISFVDTIAIRRKILAIWRG